MKTAMQELMQWMEETEFMVNVGFIDKVNECLEKEKEQIMKAVQDAYECTYNSCDSGCGGNMEIDFTPLEYYNQTYNQNK